LCRASHRGDLDPGHAAVVVENRAEPGAVGDGCARGVLELERHRLVRFVDGVADDLDEDRSHPVSLSKRQAPEVAPKSAGAIAVAFAVA